MYEGQSRNTKAFLKHLNFSFVNYHFYGVNIAYWHVYIIYVFQVQAQEVEVMWLVQIPPILVCISYCHHENMSV